MYAFELQFFCEKQPIGYAPEYVVPVARDRMRGEDNFSREAAIRAAEQFNQIYWKGDECMQ